MLGSAEALVAQSGIYLAVAAPTTLVKELKCINGEKMVHFLFPMGKGNTRRNPEYDKYWRRIKDEFKPDIVHIHGTEFSQGLSYVNTCGADNVVVSIQGMTSAYYPYYFSGLTIRELLSNITLRDLIKGGTLKGFTNFKRRGSYEIELIKKVHHIIGRTSWDQSRTWAINPNAMYHFCNETLRKDFYKGEKWIYEECCHHSIFLSQAHNSIKGLHMVLRAMPLILNHYPDTVVRVAGSDITYNSSWKERIKITDYGRIIKKLIKRNNLEGKVTFTGPLNGEKMKQEDLHCNVFVCPSTIENSPNSLGEAQILGVPCVASYVGGVSDMMKGNEENLYRFEEIEMMAHKICTIFKRGSDQPCMISVAMQRHNPEINVKTLIEIYTSIYNN